MSFDEQPSNTTASPEETRDKAEVSLAITPKPAAPPAVYVEGEDAEGEFSERDIQWHGLNLVSKTSSNAETYGIGTWLVKNEIPVGKMNDPLNVVAVKIQKAYQEQIPFGIGVRPRMFRTAEDVAEAGLSLDWGSEARAAEILGIRFWLPQPAGVDAPDIFILESPEGMGTIVKFFAARTAYGTVGKALIQASQTFLRPDKGGMASKWWEMTATRESKNGNTWLLPRVKPGKATSLEMVAFLKSLRA